MNILVYDIAASETGALAILNDFYNQAVGNKKDIEWFFVISTPKLIERDNIRVLRVPWIKKSRFHRLIFDYFFANRILKKYKIDKVLSLQNIIIPNVKVNQTVYVHQAIPFSKYRLTLTRNWRGWVYQNLIGRKIIKSIKKADKVIVQTEWMKDICSQKASIDKGKFEVIKIKPPIVIGKKYIDIPKNKMIFFYPVAGTQEYKNHLIILKACEILEKNGCYNYEVIFTFKGNENKYAKFLFNYAKEKKLNITFTGLLQKNEVFDLYTKSVLLFPSLIETVGLPLIEAKAVGSLILAADFEYATDALEDYENAYYFNPRDSESLSKLMKKSIKNDLIVMKPKDRKKEFKQIDIIDLLS
jgi:glycosyltransferase involved in cell wall biosynthesis